MGDAFTISKSAIVEKLVDFGFIPTKPGETVDADAIPDEDVSSKLRFYQAFHGIPASGEVCPATLRSFAAWRFCNHPDFMSQTMELAKWPQQPGQTVDLPWTLTNVWQNLPADFARAAVEWAFQRWADVSNLVPRFVAGTSEAVIVIEAAPIDQPGGVLAWSELPDGFTRRTLRQRYDTNERWIFDENPGGMNIDLGRVACHEIGHALGIPHIQSGNLMAPIYSTTIRVPQAGDVKEIQSRYGKKLVPIPPPTTPPTTPPTQPPTSPPVGRWRILVEGIGDIVVDAVSIPGVKATKAMPVETETAAASPG